MLKIQGLEKVEKNLKKLANHSHALNGSHEIPAAELLNEAFLRKHTRVSSLSELLEKSGFDIKSKDDLKEIPDAAWNSYIRSISSFSSWQGMISKAAEQWVAKKLIF